MSDETGVPLVYQQVAAGGEAADGPAVASQPERIARLIALPPEPIEAGVTITGIPADQPPRPWSLWATAGWCLLGACVEAVVTIGLLMIVIVTTAVSNPDTFDKINFLKQLPRNGLFLSVLTLVMTPITLAYFYPIIRWRGWRLREYLAVKSPTRRQTLRWLGICLVYMVISDTVRLLTGQEITPPSMIDAYNTAGFVPLLVVAVVLLAPFREEIVFRGFMYRGIASSRLGPAGAIAITAILWSILHVQYDWYGIADIAVCGVLVGLARHRTGSIITPMLMHVLINAGATAQLLIKMKMA